MAEPKKQPKKRERGDENLNIWIRSELVQALRNYIDHSKPRTTKTGVVEMLLEQFLAGNGFLPAGKTDGDKE